MSDGKTQTSVDGTVYMQGKRSWRVEGPANGDAVIAQLLSRVVEYIRNRKARQQRGVCFSFWYKLDDAISNGSKNQAYAQIY